MIGVTAYELPTRRVVVVVRKQKSQHVIMLIASGVCRGASVGVACFMITP